MSFLGGGMNYTPRYAGFASQCAEAVERLEPTRISGMTLQTNRADLIVVRIPVLRGVA